MLKRNWPVTAAVAVGLMLAIVALAVVLTRRADRLAGTNTYVSVSSHALPVPARGQRCARQSVPDGADRVRIYARTGSRPGQPMEVVVFDGGRPVARGHVPEGYPGDAALDIELTPRPPGLRNARVCVRNRGTRGMRFADNLTPRSGPIVGGQYPQIWMDWLLPGRPTWVGVAPRVAERFAAAKPTFVGPWTFWAVGGALALLWAGAIALVMRETRS